MAIYRVEVPLDTTTIVAQPPFTVKSAVIENQTSSSCELRDNAGNVYRNYAGQITKLSIQPSVTIQAKLDTVSNTGQCIVTLSDAFAAESAVPGYAGQPNAPPEIAFYDRSAHPQTFNANRFANAAGGYSFSQDYYPFVPGFAYYIHAAHLSLYVYDVITIYPTSVAQIGITGRIQHLTTSETITLIGGSSGSYGLIPAMYRKQAYVEISYPLGYWLTYPDQYKIFFGISQGLYQIELFASMTVHMTRYVQ